MDIIADFLEVEISSPELYKAISNFIQSSRIRNGEFEGNYYIIKKVDSENYIIYAEFIKPNGVRNIPNSFSINRKCLLETIDKNAREKKWDV